MSNSTTAAEDDPCGIVATTNTASSSSALQAVAVLYGFWFCVTLLAYCLLRNRFKTLYNVRDTVPELNCDLAKNHFGAFDWIPGVLRVSEDELFAQCGFVSVTYVRFLKIGMKLSMMGCFIAIWLSPVYRYSPTRESNAHVTDGFDKLSTGRTYVGDPRLFGTVIATYLLNFYSMYLLYYEFQWYITERHIYMSKETAQSYTIFMGGIPNRLRSKKALGDFLRMLFHDDVLDIQFAKNIAGLEQMCAEHEKWTKKLKHQEAQLDQSGRRPRTLSFADGDVDGITNSTLHLEKLAAQIHESICQLESEWEEHERRVASKDEDALTHPPKTIRDAAFVSFKSLQSSTTSLQVLHHHLPFNLLAAEAPPPEAVTWGNVGVNHWRLQLTSILAGVLTGMTIVLWTFPMIFIAGLTKVGELKKIVPFLATASDAMLVGDWRVFDDILSAAAPLALLTLNGWLPTILRFYCRLEGHIGEGTMQASVFSKLTLFNIVQTFFVSAMAGSLFDQLNCIIDDPTNQTVKILASSLPSQAVTFMGLVVVQTTFGMGVELLRIFPALYAALRRMLGPNLLEEETRQDWWGFSPLCNPGNMDYTSLTNDLVLMFIILFVYAILSPITSYVMLIGFFCLTVGYRNQALFVYDPSNDTGGKLWPKAAGYLVLCMLIAQVTIFGVLTLKESPGGALMFPLFVVTVLFWRYLQQQHLRVASTLPIFRCHEIDDERRDKRRDLAFIVDAYKQEALKFAEGMEAERGNSNGQLDRDGGPDDLRIGSAASSAGLSFRKRAAQVQAAVNRSIPPVHGGTDTGSAVIRPGAVATSATVTVLPPDAMLRGGGRERTPDVSWDWMVREARPGEGGREGESGVEMGESGGAGTAATRAEGTEQPDDAGRGWQWA